MNTTSNISSRVVVIHQITALKLTFLHVKLDAIFDAISEFGS